MAGRPLLLVAVTCVLACAADAFELQDRALGFTLQVPDDFVEYPEGRDTTDTVYAYAQSGTESSWIYFTVERMHTTVPKSAQGDGAVYRMARDLGPDVEVSPILVPWREYYLEVSRSRGSFDGAPYVRHSAEVPLRKEAIRLTVVCDQGLEGSGKALLESLLAGLEGETNWSSSDRGWGEIIASKALMKIAGVIVVGALLWFLRTWIRRPNPS